MPRSTLPSLPVLLAAATSVVSGPACGDDRPPADSTPPDTTPPCPEGQLLDGQDCVPEGCGVGTWGDLPTDPDAIFVDAAAADGGDGGAEAPVRGLQEGIEAAMAAGLDVVRVAAGTYAEHLRLDAGHAGLEVVGRCAELVVVDGSDPGGGPVVVEVDARGGALALRRLTLTGGAEGGLVVWDGDVTLTEVVVDANRMVGLVAVDRGSIDGSAVSVSGTLPAADGTWGHGVHADGGAWVSLRDSVLAGNREFGLYAGGSEVRLERVEIRDTLPNDEDELGLGLFVADGASLDATDLSLSGNHELGLYGGDATIELRDCSIADTRPRADGKRGLGAWIDGGSSLRAERCEITGNRAIGVYVDGRGTEVTLVDTVIADTQEVPGDAEGLGIRVDAEARLRVEGGELRDNTAVGLYAVGVGATVEVSGLTIRGTRATAAGDFGAGLEIFAGASLVAEDLVLDTNHQAGLGVAAASATLDGCSILGTAPSVETFGSGIAVTDGGTLVATDCHISGTRGAGLLAHGVGTTVELSSSSVPDSIEVPGLTNAARGIEIAEGAALWMSGSELSGNQGVGLQVVGEGASAVIEDSTIQGSVQYGDGRGGRGLGAEGGATVSATGMTVADNQSIGVFATGEGTTLDLSDSLVRGTRPSDSTAVAFGVFAQVGATLTATGVEVADNEGPGVYAVSEGTLLSCVGSAIAGNQFAGAVVAEAGTLELVEVAIDGTLAHGSEGGGVGVYSMSLYGFTPSLLVRDSTVGPHPYAAVWLTVPGAYQVVGNDLTGGPGQDPYDWVHLHGDAVYVTGGVGPWDESGQTGLLLGENTLRDSDGTAIFLDGASATLRNNVVVDNVTDLVQQRCEGVPLVPEAEQVGLSVIELCPDPNRSTVALELALVLLETEAEE